MAPLYSHCCCCCHGGCVVVVVSYGTSIVRLCCWRPLGHQLVASIRRVDHGLCVSLGSPRPRPRPRRRFCYPMLARPSPSVYSFTSAIAWCVAVAVCVWLGRLPLPPHLLPLRASTASSSSLIPHILRHAQSTRNRANRPDRPVQRHGRRNESVAICHTPLQSFQLLRSDHRPLPSEAAVAIVVHTDVLEAQLHHSPLYPAS
jgi:hypothetical protein